jgi:SAM domain (Sterile alpha motif)
MMRARERRHGRGRMVAEPRPSPIRVGFRENEIGVRVLPNLTAEDLKNLGVTVVGQRRRLLDAIAALRNDASSKAPHPVNRHGGRRP